MEGDRAVHGAVFVGIEGAFGTSAEIRYAINESGGCLYDVRADRILRHVINDAVTKQLFRQA